MSPRSSFILNKMGNIHTIIANCYFKCFQGFTNLGFVKELDEVGDDEIDSVLGSEIEGIIFFPDKSVNITLNEFKKNANIYF